MTGGDPSSAATKVREELLRVMSRQERPTCPVDIMSVERVRTANRVTAEDLAGYAQLHHVARQVRQDRDHGLVTPEYWKSAPYFINFCDGYQLGAVCEPRGWRRRRSRPWAAPSTSSSPS